MKKVSFGSQTQRFRIWRRKQVDDATGVDESLDDSFTSYTPSVGPADDNMRNQAIQNHRDLHGTVSID